jgi:hypothetical protein
MILMTIKTDLIAPCGMNCGICMAYLREKNKCPGCREIYINEPISRSGCKIKNCDYIAKKKNKFCIGCKSLPCKRMKNLDKRYRTRYNMSMLENLDNIKKLGIRQFVKNEKIRWKCPHCGGTICVHRWYCFTCGKRSSP